ncbi:MAG: hypothetical protein H0X64_07885 [Gemmatimonadaceae bacterium]|nr:hypothetical protein [Gemmatimonadaceae bacterium]
MRTALLVLFALILVSCAPGEGPLSPHEWQGVTQTQFGTNALRLVYTRYGNAVIGSYYVGRSHVEATLDTTRQQQERFNVVTDRTMLSIDAVSSHLTALAARLDSNLEHLESVRATMLASMDAGFTRTSEAVGGEFARATDAVAKSASALAEPVGSLQELIRRSIVGDVANSAVLRVSASADALSQAVARWEGVTTSTLGDGGVAASLRQLDATLREIEARSLIAPAGNGAVPPAAPEEELATGAVAVSPPVAAPEVVDSEVETQQEVQTLREDAVDPVRRWPWGGGTG